MKTMTSLSEIFRIGRGPSSSHTMGPEKACRYIMEKYPDADSVTVTLLGSLAKTGKGHRTDYAIEQTLGGIPCTILFDSSDIELPHPNTMEFRVFRSGAEIGRETVLSIGGGAIQVVGEDVSSLPQIYSLSTFSGIASFCETEHISLSGYVFRCEPEIRAHLLNAWRQMQETIEAGLSACGELPGGLHVKRRAAELGEYGRRERDLVKKERFLISAFAYASSEENAAGGKMVTAPTCGACGVLPAVLYYEKQLFVCSDDEIADALAVAGIIGQIIKTNASVSGAEAGCQAEIGSACSMASAALCSLRGFGLAQIECAAELAMEHCLGLTCDPVNGLVQIPCIERNAVGALRSYDAAALSEIIYDSRKVSFDDIVRTMYQTGKDLSRCYRETAEGGLAKTYTNKNV